MGEDLHFDYVIVGAGSAGSCLAGRLSEDPATRVCLIEAGPSNRTALVAIPGLLVFLLNHRLRNWNLRSAAHAHLGGRQVSIPRGRGLGGSSSINSMVYIRGRASDYNAWAAAGCTGWDWDSVLPVFKAMENNARLGADPLHGSDGPLHVEDLASASPLLDLFAEAGAQLQIPRNVDFNGVSQEGLGAYQVTMHNARRWSAADAYLTPALSRPNLVVMTGTEARKIDLHDGRAVAVQVHDGHTGRRIVADGEVILAAGAIHSPALLLRSGIGDPAELARIGITPLVDLPGVGANLHDHPAAMIHMEGGHAGYGLALSQLPGLALAPFDYLFRRKGLLASNMVEGGGFARTGPDLAEPDVQFHFIPGRVGHRGRMIEWGRGFYSDVCVLKPHSRGRLTLASPDPAVAPSIDLNLLSDDRDKQTLLRGFGLLRRILNSPTLRATGAHEASPGPAIATEDQILAHFGRSLGTAYHPVGTCRMGDPADRRTVVDPTLKVVGVDRLRVIDAAIMPEVIAGNTNAPTIMIAEKGAALVRNQRHNRRQVG